MDAPKLTPKLQSVFMVGSVLVTLGALIVIQPLLAPAPQSSAPTSPAADRAPAQVSRAEPAELSPLAAPLPSRQEIDRLVQEAWAEIDPALIQPIPAIEDPLANPQSDPETAATALSSLESPVSAVPGPIPSAIQVYTVKPGDTLSEIAYERYGSLLAYRDIFEANRQVLDRPEHLPIGQKLHLPGDLSQSQSQPQTQPPRLPPRPRARPNDRTPSRP